MTRFGDNFTEDELKTLRLGLWLGIETPEGGIDYGIAQKLVSEVHNEMEKRSIPIPEGDGDHLGH